MRKMIVVLLTILNLVAQGQKIPEIGINVRITQADKTVVAEIKAVNSDLKISPSAIYFWYGSGGIHQTQGGFSQRLLNGAYNEYYLNKNLKEQGVFNKGLQNGLWKSWKENGVLTQIITYTKGIKSGPFILYNDKGEPKQSGFYKKNELDGKIKFFSKDSTKITTYKIGKILPPKTKTGFWSRLNIFKRHSKPAADTSKKKN